MRAFWRHIELAHLNFALVAAILALGFAYRPQLAWSLRALPLYVTGKFPEQIELRLYKGALLLLQAGRERERAKRLLERSIAIDPHSGALLALAEVHYREGKLERALEQFRAYRRIDPGSLLSYQRIGEIHRRRGRAEQRQSVLEEGVAYFRKQVEAYQPHYDASVKQTYNAKAQQVYDAYVAALGALEKELEKEVGTGP